MAAQKTFACTKDNVSRPDAKTGAGGRDYLPVGYGSSGVTKNKRHFLYLDFDDDWTGVGQIVRAELALTNTTEEDWSRGATPAVTVGRVEDTWSEGTSETYISGNYVSKIAITTGMPKKIDLTDADNDTQFIDVTPLIEQIAPTRVLKRNGDPCGGRPFRGFRVWGYAPDGKQDPKYRTEFYGRTNGTSSRRPRLIVTYEVGKVAPSAPTLGQPSGSVASNAEFEVTFSSLQPDDKMGKVEVTLWNGAGTTELWKREFGVSESERVSGIFTTGLPSVVIAGTSYQWAARTADTGGTWGPYATKKTFSVGNTAPVVTPIDPPADLTSLLDFHFRATYSDADGDPMKWFRVQVSEETNPLGDWSALLWDSETLAPGPSGEIEAPYGGAALTSDTTYGYRIKSGDTRGAESAWAYGTFTTATTYMGEGDITTSFTGYNRKKRAPYRIVLRDVDRAAGRGPKAAPVAVITDASNVGWSYFANSPGDFFFTLPTNHPQVAACEPYQTHWSLQFYRGDQWVEKGAGLLTDFDTTEDEVIFYGIDYLGTLTFSADERYDKDKPDKPYTSGGSKYSDIQLHAIIADQIDTGKAQTGSTYGFITRPTSGSLWDVGLSERATLVTTFEQTFNTVMGLIESHKQGYGRRPRLWVEKTGPISYRWRLKGNAGQDRPNLRIELGGLLNGYRVVGFGAFGTVVHGVGRVKDEVTVRYEKAESPVDDGVSTAIDIWGRVSHPMVWNDLLDANDLKRRVQEKAMQVGKVGKQVALPLKVDGLLPLDGFDVLDSFPLTIKDGVVDTERYGSGMYTILGMAWRLYPDGHTDLVLSITPKEDGDPVNPDLITTTDPILPQSDWVIDYGGPTQQTSGKWYLDQVTGRVYRWDGDLQDWVLYIPEINPQMLFVDPDNPNYQLKFEAGALMCSVDGGATWEVLLNADGTVADGINYGNLPGGSNLIPDGSFEMLPFPTTAPLSDSIDTDADWGTGDVFLTYTTATSGTIRLTSAT